ncbi:hypothetical protein [Ruegeria faecimaris]|uniref:hypothetical protein n=1 Tax=Ruegeria faecimaris TaxID=686389 RepID=UPI00232F1609|nr:hypothetical protein [Ruegeria faecimaris]
MTKTADTTIALKRKRSEGDEDSDQKAAADTPTPVKPANPKKPDSKPKDDADKKDSLKPIKQVWQSGDFHKTGRNKPPYNGLQISVQYKVDDAGKFEDVTVTFTDYTYSKDGVSSKIQALAVSDGWVEVPKPAKPKSSSDTKASTSKGDKGKTDFTVVGHVKISGEPDGKFLRLRLKSGLEPGFQQLGFIMRLSPPPSSS